MSERVEAYLVKNKSISHEGIADIWQKLEQLLWHQLTVELRKVISDDAFIQTIDLKDFYDNFINEFEHRINPLQLVEIVIPVAKSIFVKNRDAAFTFLSKIERTISKDKQAVVRVRTGQIELRLMHKDSKDRCVDIQIVRVPITVFLTVCSAHFCVAAKHEYTKQKMIEETQILLDELLGVTPVHGPFYKVSSVYLKEIGNYAGYYREALRYLGCEDQTKLSQSEKQLQAVLLGFAALLGDNVYNFGELLAHPILKSLEGTREKWIIDLLYAFNSGDLNKFNEYRAQWAEWDDLKDHQDLLEDKIRLLSLMEIALARPSKERYISFQEIADKAQIDLNKVEALVMRALSKELVQGSIDQVEELVNITWVQPRILAMSDRISAWCAEVEGMEAIVRNNAREILTKT
ncbi:26S proteasome non-ATPase regulatory subunit 13 [Dirofilaria immitis]|nr:26S proteasome non-ATPase regulatory subunit 13 [Dirofilaria immitis]